MIQRNDFIIFVKDVTPQISCIKVLLRSVFKVSTYLAKLETKKKIGVSLHVIEQWRYEVDLFALKSDFCIICFIHIYIMLCLRWQ